MTLGLLNEKNRLNLIRRLRLLATYSFFIAYFIKVYRLYAAIYIQRSFATI